VTSGQAYELLDELIGSGSRPDWVPAGALEVRWDGANVFQVRRPGGESRHVLGARNVVTCLVHGDVVPGVTRPLKREFADELHRGRLGPRARRL
jgi:hypothetical protein